MLAASELRKFLEAPAMGTPCSLTLQRRHPEPDGAAVHFGLLFLPSR